MKGVKYPWQRGPFLKSSYFSANNIQFLSWFVCKVLDKYTRHSKYNMILDNAKMLKMRPSDIHPFLSGLNLMVLHNLICSKITFQIPLSASSNYYSLPVKWFPNTVKTNILPSCDIHVICFKMDEIGLNAFWNISSWITINLIKISVL